MMYYNNTSNAVATACNMMCFACGMVLGAGLMYMFDPDRGNRRRALVRDKAYRYSREAQHALGRTARYNLGRAKGLYAETKNAVTSEEVTDRQLRDRVRAELGHTIRNAGAIDVTVRDGVVTLRGSVAEDEAGKLLDTVASVRSVCEVRDQLTREGSLAYAT